MNDRDIRNASVSATVRKLNPHLFGGVAPDPVGQQSAVHEPVAEDPRSHRDKIRRLVRITSFRTRECDERNLFDKYATDALVHAGILFDDSPRWCKVEVEQKPVAHKWEERTEIEITELPGKEL
jgi:hypothetical protein